MNNQPEPFEFGEVQLISPEVADTLTDIFFVFFFWLQVVGLFIALVALIGAILSAVGISQVRARERAALEALGEIDVDGPVAGRNPKWLHIQELLDSEREADWRMAILEADIMLEDMIERMQYPGETLGEKLKGVERGDFQTIDNAWEAHKIRNMIAHEGGDFILTHREAQRVLKLYESVFEEFQYI